uniref:MurL N-terminal domain-containing protein n=1 Tax=Amphimedon queenslandica TaxID=400682 RepID=A0A1X7TYW7_AMPQE
MATRNLQEKKRVASLGDTARLELISHSGPQLHMSYRLSGGLYFSTTVWYPFQLEELDTKYGTSFMEEIYFHCALFEMNKLCTLAPSLKYIDLGDWSKYFNKKLGELWRVLTIKSFGEWRFLNNLKNWEGPEFFGSNVVCSKIPVISIEGGPVRCLAFNGGGKDSLASMKLLEDIGEPFHSISYAHSMFGQVERQRGLTESLVKFIMLSFALPPASGRTKQHKTTVQVGVMATRNHVQEKERVASLGDTARLELISHSGPQLYMSYRLSGGLYFSTTVWYPFQLEELDTKYGASFMEEIYFHCALFEMNKLCALVPSLKYIDLGDWSKYFNKKLGELWRVLAIKSFHESRYLNNILNWKGPEFFGSDIGCSKNPVISIESGPVHCLAFNGGGKDSLASMKLLEDIGEPFHSISYAYSKFGKVQGQYDLTESLVKYTASKAHHRLTIDTFMSSPLPGVIPNAEVKSIVAFSLFSAIIEALPLVLMHGYTSICLGNERNANKGNLVWDGEEINHQWIKSYECESLLSSKRI